jgi:hypothetical protein
MINVTPPPFFRDMIKYTAIFEILYPINQELAVLLKFWVLVCRI